MRKLISAALLLALVQVGCKKSTVSNVATADTSETVNVSLTSGDSYRYSINANSNNVSITSDAQNAAQSRISIVPGVDTLTTYEYVPASGFTGTDVVTIQVIPTCTNTPSQSGCHSHVHHPQRPDSCGGHGGNQPPNHGPPPSGGCGSKSAHGMKHITLRFTVTPSQN